jgi:hypothetical protein
MRREDINWKEERKWQEDEEKNGRGDREKKRERNRRGGRENRRFERKSIENLAYYMGSQIQQIIAKGKKAKHSKSKGYKTKVWQDIVKEKEKIIMMKKLAVRLGIINDIQVPGPGTR